MWFLPSRSRPLSLKRFFTHYELTNSDSEGVVWLDEDDAHNYENIAFPAKWQRLIRPRQNSLGDTQNALFKEFPNEPWYGFMADDVVPLTKGWDKALIKAAGSDGLGYCDDGINGIRHSSHPCVGGDLVRELGWISLPGTKRLYMDNALMEYAKHKGKITYLKDVKIEHLHWTNGKRGFDENDRKPTAESDRAVFESWLSNLKKDDSIVITCVNWGNYCGRGAEYVNVLFDMIGRNTSDKIKFEFVCFTDDAEGLNPLIRAEKLPDGMKGWWNKLYLFKKGLFPNDKQIFYFDLDVAITGNISDILSYKGDFALIRDFYHPERISNAIMSWKADNNTIYEDWKNSGGSEIGTDQTYIEAVFKDKKPDLFQDLYRGMIVSYKVEGQYGIPQHARVICFHGEPRPHEAGGWVDRVWKIGGDSVADYILHCNTDDDTLDKQIMLNADRDIEVVTWNDPHDKIALLVGGGPSLNSDLPLLQFYKQNGAIIFAINGALDYLEGRGIKVDAHIMLDARPENIEFVREKLDATYYLASQVHPSVFDYLHENTVKLFHPNIPGLYEKLAGKKQGAMIGGGRTAGLMAMGLVYALGYRNIHLFGYDSSYKENNHAYAQPMNIKDKVVEVEYEGVKYKSSPWMVQQAENFMPLAQALVGYGCEITVHGSGLLPAIANSMQIPETLTKEG